MFTVNCVASGLAGRFSAKIPTHADPPLLFSDLEPGFRGEQHGRVCNQPARLSLRPCHEPNCKKVPANDAVDLHIDVVDSVGQAVQLAFEVVDPFVDLLLKPSNGLLDIGSEFLVAVVEAVVDGHEGKDNDAGENARGHCRNHPIQPVTRTSSWLLHLSGAILYVWSFTCVLVLLRAF